MTPPPGLPRLSIEGPVARIVLERPEQHNAIEARDVACLRGHLADVAARAEVRVLVLTGSGDASFCSGASLAEMETGEMTGALFETLADDLADARVPSICALNGSGHPRPEVVGPAAGRSSRSAATSVSGSRGAVCRSPRPSWASATRSAASAGI